MIQRFQIILFLMLCHAVSASEWKEYTVSFYCHCKICCGRSGQPTASGRMPLRFRTVAAPRALPFGTKLEIEGLGVRVVEDRAALKYDSRIDVFVGSDPDAHARAKQLGIKKRKARTL